MASFGNEGHNTEPTKPARSWFHFSLTTRIILALLLHTACLAGLVLLAIQLGWSLVFTGQLILLLGVLLSFVLGLRVTAFLTHGMEVLRIGLSNYRAGDYSIRLAVPEQPELRELTLFFNHMADLARQEHGTIYQKELLLDTLVQATPMAILLVGPHGRLVLANHEARHIFGLDKPLTHLKLEDLLLTAQPVLKDALDQSHDALFTLNQGDESETYHLSQRNFVLNTLPHRLIMVKHMTHVLRRQEVATWKKMIRLINHELNNTLAPLRSLQHSARILIKQPPDQHYKLERIFQTMEGVISDLGRFLEDYATFARLPLPRKERVIWADFLRELQTLANFQLNNRLSAEEGFFDPAQIRQALVNLLKNAREASPEESSVELSLSDRPGSGCLIQVRDRGKGMKAEAMEKALLPFFSTKKTGTGLGLPLCREIIEAHDGQIRLQAREGGGLVVSLSLPS